ncbi:hypothetical protein DQ04_17581000 [Trypanosoma grayi]|uniref:hypothetical protein n=1 Tax=Trypanosoma grayi TaxID=71804 RepID=UPI0004F4274B|nr:hypothetical protein DQ04_17581000 [Trypanosoma grayi]KEG05884.1 hypothetical protein DQ04_17581000 [Trypanosoma grayi]
MVSVLHVPFRSIQLWVGQSAELRPVFFLPYEWGLAGPRGFYWDAVASRLGAVGGGVAAAIASGPRCPFGRYSVFVFCCIPCGASAPIGVPHSAPRICNAKWVVDSPFPSGIAPRKGGGGF